MFGVDDVIGGAMGLISGGITNQWAGNAAQHAMDFTASQNQASMAFSAEQASRQMDFQERMSGSAYQRAVADMEKAGLNPMLAYSQGGASIPSGSAGAGATGSGVTFQPVNAVQQGISTAMQSEKLNAEVDKLKSEKTEIDTRVGAGTYEANVASVNQRIIESQAMVDKLKQDTATGAASAGEIAQRTKNLEAQLPQIRSQIKLLEAQAKLTSGQSEEQRQKNVEMIGMYSGVLRRVEAELAGLGKPKASTEAMFYRGDNATGGGGVIGSLGTLGKILNPFSGMFK